MLKRFIKGSAGGVTVGEDAEIGSYGGLTVNFVQGAIPTLEIFDETGEPSEDGKLPILTKVELTEVGNDLAAIRELLAANGFHPATEGKAEL